MPAALSLDLRRRIIEAVEAGDATQDEVAARFKVGVASVVRLVALKKATGGLDPKPRIGGRVLRKIDESYEAALIEILQNEPDLTILELTHRYEEATGTAVSTSTMSRTIQRIGWTRKKKR